MPAIAGYLGCYIAATAVDITEPKPIIIVLISSARYFNRHLLTNCPVFDGGGPAVDGISSKSSRSFVSVYLRAASPMSW